MHSPELLMLSGVGPADHLREVGVDVVHDLTGVGARLQDHPPVPVIWHVRSGKSLFRAESSSGYARWFAARRGPPAAPPTPSWRPTPDGAARLGRAGSDHPDAATPTWFSRYRVTPAEPYT